MKISKNFDVREFVPKHLWDKWGTRCTWFVNPKIVHIAEFYKTFFLAYYKKKLGNDNVLNVLIQVNTWHTGGSQEWRGLRTAKCTEGTEDSLHRYMSAFDCDIIIVMKDGSKVEADYKEIHKVIKENETEFLANGVSAVEDVAIAGTWLHTDCRWIPEQKNILIVKPA